MPLYLVYWHYRQWKAYRVHRRFGMWPIFPALFFTLTGFGLFSRIKDVAAEHALKGWDGVFLGFATLLMLGVAQFGRTNAGMEPLAFAALLVWVPALVAQPSARADGSPGPANRPSIAEGLLFAALLAFWAIGAVDDPTTAIHSALFLS